MWDLSPRSSCRSLLAAAIVASCQSTGVADRPWARHSIDAASQGADGVRLADVNHDGLEDLAVAWEEGGITRIYLHPGYDKVRQSWPAATIGRTPDAEDAVFCDVDRDGAVDVVTCCEGRTRAVFVHWGPQEPGQHLQGALWKTDSIAASRDQTAWMMAAPMDGGETLPGVLAVGSRGNNAMIGLLQAASAPRDTDHWQLRPLYRAGWIMSLVSIDLDRDGDLDLIASDRRGSHSGILWLENPGAGLLETRWAEHRIGASGREVMFLDVTDLDRDGQYDIVVAVKPRKIHWLRPTSDLSAMWSEHTIKFEIPAGTELHFGNTRRICIVDYDKRQPGSAFECLVDLHIAP